MDASLTISLIQLVKSLTILVNDYTAAKGWRG